MAVVRHFAGNICSKFSAPFAVNLDSLFKEKNNAKSASTCAVDTRHTCNRRCGRSGVGARLADPARHRGRSFAAGSSTDTAARILAVGMSEALGQQLVIENVGGAAGMTGTLRVARSAPDGYQMLFERSTRSRSRRRCKSSRPTTPSRTSLRLAWWSSSRSC